MRWRYIVCLALIWTGASPSGQGTPDIPSLPREERFVIRTDLKATLKISKSALVIGETPAFSVVLQNTGAKTLRVPEHVGLDLNVTRRVFTSSGEEVLLPVTCVRHQVTFPGTASSLLALLPQQSREFNLEGGCSSPWPALPAGEYEVRATYQNYPDSPFKYDVYEKGGSEAWDGEIEMPAVALTVQPLDDVAERRRMIALTSQQPSLLQRADGPTSERPAELEPQPEVSSLDDYISAVTSGVGFETGNYLPLRGIARFGTKETYGRLRAAIEKEPKAGARIATALWTLTFAAHDRIDLTSPAYWDGWWKTHGRRSRRDWARDALERKESLETSLSGDPITASWRAAEYLVTSESGSHKLVRELSRHRSWRVRLAAADALGAFDRRYAGRLMIRELGNRYIAACEVASERLAQVTRAPEYRLNCRSVAERQQAVAYWTKLVEQLPTLSDKRK